MGSLDLGKLKIRVGVDNTEVKQGFNETKSHIKKTSVSFSKLAKGLKTGLTKSFKIAGAAITAVGGALVAVCASTKELRQNLGKLNTAFTTNGFTAEDATEVYTKFYGILGESDQAVEAANHLALLCDNQQDLTKWTTIATGVFATFGDSLPIENLTEAANETAKTGKIVGSLADALNWVGISEDNFQQSLNACTSEQERQILITESLNSAYSEAAAVYEDNNQALITANELQSKLKTSLANLGGAIEGVTTQFTSQLLPSISDIIDGLTGLIKGADDAKDQLSKGIKDLAKTITKNIPDFLNAAVDIISALIDGINEALPEMKDAIIQLVLKIVQTINENLPMIVQVAIEIINALVNGLAENMPTLIPQIVQCILLIVDTILNNLDQIIEAGLNIIVAIIEGIINALPDLAEKIPEIIYTIVVTLIKNLPKVIASGGKIIWALIQGIYNSLKSLFESTGNVIKEGVLKPIGNFFSKLWEQGKQLVKSVWGGIKDWGKNLWQNITNFVSEKIVQPIKDIWSRVKECGSNLIKGLWQGISDKAKWLWDKVSGWCSNLVGKIKHFFGINSPSTMFKGFGKNMIEGLGIGISDNMDYATEAIDDANKTIAKRFKPQLDFKANLGRYGYGVGSGSFNNAVASMPSASNNSNITQNNYFTEKTLTPYETTVQIKKMNKQLAEAF